MEWGLALALEGTACEVETAAPGWQGLLRGRRNSRTRS